MLQPIILAAGKGTRMQSELPKAIYPFLGKPLLRWVTDALSGVSGAKKPIIVVGYKAEEVMREMGESFTYALQSDISGTASAVKAALPYVSPEDSVLILYTDQPFPRPESIEAMGKMLEENPDALVMGTAVVEDFNDWREAFMKFGRIVRNADGSVKNITEYKDATEGERAILEVNPGVYCAKAAWLAQAISRITPSPISGEYYLTDIVSLAEADKKTILTASLAPEEALGINSLDDAARAERLAANQ